MSDYWVDEQGMHFCHWTSEFIGHFLVNPETREVSLVGLMYLESTDSDA